MTTPMQRRVAKLEAAANAIADGDVGVHVVFVHPGEDADKKIAALGPIRRVRGVDPFIVVRFVRAADINSPSTLQ